MKTAPVYLIIIFLLEDPQTWAKGDPNCPEILEKDNVNIQPSCSDGKLFVNGKKIVKLESTDRVLIISNNLLINGKFRRYFPPYGLARHPSQNNNWNGNHLTSRASNSECPSLMKIGCINVNDHCVNGKLYINGKRIKNVESGDKVAIVSNNLYINDEFIRYIPPFGVNDEPRRPRTKKKNRSRQTAT